MAWCVPNRHEQTKNNTNTNTKSAPVSELESAPGGEKTTKWAVEDEVEIGGGLLFVNDEPKPTPEY